MKNSKTNSYLVHFPGVSVKNLPATQETRVQFLFPERSPEENGNPLQYSCLENSMDREA